MKRTLLIIAALTVLSGCISRQEIRANLWLNNGLPSELCDKEPALKDHGFYRKLDSGKLEFISFCSPLGLRMFAIVDQDLETLLDKTLPENKQ